MAVLYTFNIFAKIIYEFYINWFQVTIPLCNEKFEVHIVHSIVAQELF